MDITLPSLLVPLAITLPLAIIAIGVMWQRGHLAPGSLAGAPDRGLDLGGSDLLLAALLLLGGQFLVGPMILTLGLPSGPPEDLTVDALAGRVVIGQFLTLGPIAIFFLMRARDTAGGLDGAGLRPGRPLREAAAGGLALLGMAPIVATTILLVTLAGWLAGLPPPPAGHPLVPVLQDAPFGPGLALLLVGVWVVAPLLEEVVFRGLVQSAFLEITGHRYAAIAIAAMLFTGMHAGVPWQSLPGLFVLGLSLGWLYERYGSLWPAIILHAGFNGVNTGMAWVVGGSG